MLPLGPHLDIMGSGEIQGVLSYTGLQLCMFYKWHVRQNTEEKQ